MLQYSSFGILKILRLCNRLNRRQNAIQCICLLQWLRLDFLRTEFAVYLPFGMFTYVYPKCITYLKLNFQTCYLMLYIILSQLEVTESVAYKKDYPVDLVKVRPL